MEQEKDTIRMHDGVCVLRATSKSNVNRLSDAIAHAVIEDPKKDIEIRALGPEALCQAVKAFINAKGRLSQRGINPTLDPYFRELPDEKYPGQVVNVLCCKIQTAK